jgi:hypothetical protein
MKEEYQNKRKWSNFNWLVRPSTVEYIEVRQFLSILTGTKIEQFEIWNVSKGYISVRKRPDCVPNESPDYDFTVPPPMPAEVFIHYLHHGEGDLSRTRNDFIGRLPKRRSKHDAGQGYGVHIIEGPYYLGIFILSMFIMFCTVVTSIAWSAKNNDVQGGTGIGALIVACYTLFLTVWIFWRTK